MPDKMDLESDIQINKYKLDDECVVQASRYFHWAERQAEAKITVDRAENRLKLTQAEALGRAKSALERAGDKTTVDAIAAKAAQDKEVHEAQDALMTAREDLYRLDAAVRALDHRKAELDNLTRLYAASYFSIPDGGVSQDRPNPIAAGSRDARRALNKE